MTKPKSTIVVNEEIDTEKREKYFSVSGKILNREFYRVGKFLTKEEAIKHGKYMCGGGRIK
jgi:hypothetical protein